MKEELNCFLMGLFPWIVFALLPIAAVCSPLFSELIDILLEKIFGNEHNN